MEMPDGKQQIEAAQLQKLKLENEKLILDLEKLRSKPSWYQFPVQLVPMVTAVVSVSGFIWGVVQVTNQQADIRKEQAAQTQRNFMKPWLETQWSTYTEALGAASIATSSKDNKERAAAKDKFWNLYHGAMILVENTDVSKAMGGVAGCIDRPEDCDVDEVHRRVHTLASVMAKSMATTAEMSYEEFSKNQFDYSPQRQ